ncbi:hypothetical protein Tco_1260453 [Tanacetum coccineum]
MARTDQSNQELLLANTSKKATWLWQEAQEKLGFALIALTKEAHMSLSRIAKLAIRSDFSYRDQISFDEETALNLQAEFDEEERLAKIDVDHQLAKRLQAQEQEELSIKENAILFQQLLEKRRKHFAAKRSEEKRNKPPTKSQQRKIMCTYLKNMEGYKLKDLKSKGFDSIQEMFDRAFKRVNTFEDFRTELVEGKEKRAGIELVQESTKKQKVEDDKETT